MERLDTPGQRLRHARKLAGFKSSAAFARHIGMMEGTYRHHENMTRGIPRDQLEPYAKELNVSVEWLLTGEGDMALDEAKISSRSPVSIVVKLSPSEFEKLTPRQKLISDLSIGSVYRETVPVPGLVENAFAIDVPDESLSRRFNHGASVIVDMGDRQLVDDKPYLIRASGANVLRVFKNGPFGKRFEADSIQRNYEPIAADAIEGVIGRVIGMYQAI